MERMTRGNDDVATETHRIRTERRCPQCLQTSCPQTSKIAMIPLQVSSPSTTGKSRIRLSNPINTNKPHSRSQTSSALPKVIRVNSSPHRRRLLRLLHPKPPWTTQTPTPRRQTTPTMTETKSSVEKSRALTQTIRLSSRGEGSRGSRSDGSWGDFLDLWLESALLPWWIIRILSVISSLMWSGFSARVVIYQFRRSWMVRVFWIFFKKYSFKEDPCNEDLFQEGGSAKMVYWQN